ncbi:arylsulfatase B-like [Copidosoma floridanum]|uniref:arylsulfatase B-like n=1 Tax=Copidosoma floridanum TaxID=29053 RepID=UPI0006C9630A|nr:arylsulfatase B-like [Copidosoma floridanum]XP_023246227.1 arylsulfatase B-like [Copidosoma floridanum]
MMRRSRLIFGMLAIAGGLLNTAIGQFDSPPHIIVFMADDLGWNDVGFHGSTQIPTPNIDALAYNGIILNKHYALPSCTPTRAAFLSGKYPIRMGMQGAGILGGEPRGIPLNVRILPEYLQGLGYDTKLIGKWHVGYHTPRHTPTRRGFDYFLGFYNSYIGYYDYRYLQGNMSGFDMHANESPAYGTEGQYATDLFTATALEVISRHDVLRPLYLQVSHLAPHAPLDTPYYGIDNDEFLHIGESNRRAYAKMVARLDESLGRIVSSLGDKGMLRNSVIVFMSDNGAAPIGKFRNFGSNWPLRGTKYTLFEGGVRSVAAIWSPRLISTARVSDQLFHVTDWLPTLYSVAGGDLRDLGQIDGVNQWDVLSIGTGHVRDRLLLNIDEVTRTEAAIYQRFKFVRGSLFRGYYDNAEGETGRGRNAPIYNTTRILKSAVSDAIREHLGVPVTQESGMWHLQSQATVLCRPNMTNPHYTNRYYASCNESECLFDLSVDPCETNNIAKSYPRWVAELDLLIKQYNTVKIPQLRLPVDYRADPKYWNYTWQPWLDLYDSYYSSYNAGAAIGTVAVCAHVALFLVIVGLRVFI